MGSVWFSKKAFLYFGGAAIILIGGALVLMAPYHYINFAILENERRTFDVWDEDGYYPQVEFSVSIRFQNETDIEIGLVLVENVTLDTYIVNISLTSDNLIETNDASFLETSIVEDIPFGNYTITIDRIDGAGLIDLGLRQMSDSKLWIGVGGSMNVLGLLMGIGGYFVPGHFLPTDADTIVEWGYDEEEKDSYQGN